MNPLHPEKLTWAALLGRWIDFARSAVGLPDTPEGRAWRKAVPSIIYLQAICMAANDARQLPLDELALGLDRARLLFDEHTRQLSTNFDGDIRHPMLLELITETRQAIQQMQHQLEAQRDAK